MERSSTGWGYASWLKGILDCEQRQGFQWEGVRVELTRHGLPDWMIDACRNDYCKGYNVRPVRKKK